MTEKQRDSAISGDEQYKTKIAPPRKGAIFILNRNPGCFCSSFLFRLAPVAGLGSSVVQAHETLPVFIGLKTEFQRFLRWGLRLRPVRRTTAGLIGAEMSLL